MIRQAETGLGHTWSPGNRLDVTAFRSDVRDFIEKNDTTDKYENRDRYRIRGIEIASAVRPLVALFLRAGATFLDAKDLSSGSGRDELQYRPRRKYTLEGGYEFSERWSAYLSLLHVGGQVYYSRILRVQKGSLNDYTLVNVRLKHALPDRTGSLYIGADNLFDRNYETSYGFPQAGRFVYAGVEWRL